ncbi:MAG: hypothetical protein AAFV98_08370 [Chloroflexota bacterium]
MSEQARHARTKHKTYERWHRWALAKEISFMPDGIDAMLARQIGSKRERSYPLAHPADTAHARNQRQHASVVLTYVARNERNQQGTALTHAPRHERPPHRDVANIGT